MGVLAPDVVRAKQLHHGIGSASAVAGRETVSAGVSGSSSQPNSGPELDSCLFGQLAHFLEFRGERGTGLPRCDTPVTQDGREQVELCVGQVIVAEDARCARHGNVVAHLHLVEAAPPVRREERMGAGDGDLSA